MLHSTKVGLIPKNFLFRNCTELFFKNISRWGMRSLDVAAAHNVCYFLLLGHMWQNPI